MSSGSCCSCSCTAHVPSQSPARAEAGRSKPRHSTWGALPTFCLSLASCSSTLRVLRLDCILIVIALPPPEVHVGQQAPRITRTCNCIAPLKLLFSRDSHSKLPSNQAVGPPALCPARRGREPGLGAWVDAYTSESRPSDRQSEPVPTWSEPASGDERHAPG